VFDKYARDDTPNGRVTAAKSKPIEIRHSSPPMHPNLPLHSCSAAEAASLVAQPLV
jgi:hypothetical protein